ncbi:22365_t:CDS:2 [Rhizophagus irregularis]|nr:22365_t:CDS:2 [Rhizophagus irregularis]
MYWNCNQYIILVPAFMEIITFHALPVVVTAALSKSTLEQLGGIYDGEFKVVYEMMVTANCKSNSGGSSTSGGPSKPGGNNGDIKGRKVIKVSSVASVESEGHIQIFGICVHFHANIYNDDEFNRMLLISADISECRAGQLLNQNWKQLSNLGSGYYLESVTISFFPITDATNNRSALYELEYYFPKMKNRTVESLGALSKSITGDYWTYEYGKRSPDQVQLEPGNHTSKWLIVNKLMDFKPKLAKVSHTLEINFNGLEDFNEKFMSLERFRSGENLIFTVNNNTCTDVTAKTDSGFVNIERSVYNEKN